MEGTRHQRQGRIREDGSDGSPTVQCGAEHKRSADEASDRGVEAAGSAEARSPFPAVACKGDRFTRSSAFLTWRDLLASSGSFPPVVVEDERTRR